MQGLYSRWCTVFTIERFILASERSRLVFCGGDYLDTRRCLDNLSTVPSIFSQVCADISEPSVLACVQQDLLFQFLFQWSSTVPPPRYPLWFLESLFPHTFWNIGTKTFNLAKKGADFYNLAFYYCYCFVALQWKTPVWMRAYTKVLEPSLVLCGLVSTYMRHSFKKLCQQTLLFPSITLSFKHKWEWFHLVPFIVWSYSL